MLVLRTLLYFYSIMFRTLRTSRIYVLLNKESFFQVHKTQGELTVAVRSSLQDDIMRSAMNGRQKRLQEAPMDWILGNAEVATVLLYGHRVTSQIILGEIARTAGPWASSNFFVDCTDSYKFTHAITQLPVRVNCCYNDDPPRIRKGPISSSRLTLFFLFSLCDPSFYFLAFLLSMFPILLSRGEHILNPWHTKNPLCRNEIYLLLTSLFSTKSYPVKKVSLYSIKYCIAGHCGK